MDVSLKTPIHDIDATPLKSVYLSIIADYDLKWAICELIDNAIDAWRAARRSDALDIKISIDTDQKTIRISDNAGGVKKDDLKVLVSPGAAAQSTLDDSIGFFGVGSKRSVVALAEQIWITTRHKTGSSYRIEYDDEWIHDAASEWRVPAFKVSNISEDSTEIELTKLRISVEEKDVAELIAHLSVTYANFLETENIWLTVNEIEVEPQFFTQWAFPEEYKPLTTKKILTDKVNGPTEFRITRGLTYEERTLTGDYGVFVYCNRRLIARALRSSDVGFATGLAGIPHHNMNLARIIVEFEGPAKNMPWTSKKDGINYNHAIFQAVRDDIISTVENCTKWSKVLKPDFATKVEPFVTGDIPSERVAASKPIKSRLPSPPRMRVDFKETIVSVNKGLVLRKPYIRGLYESIIAEEVIWRQKILTQRNRISWIILDSAVEIGCKEYLVNEVSNGISDERLKGLTREALENEVQTHVLKGDDIWRRFRYGYQIRNNFIHRKADVTVPDDDVEQFRHDVKRFLIQAFGIKFPS